MAEATENLDTETNIPAPPAPGTPAKAPEVIDPAIEKQLYTDIGKGLEQKRAAQQEEIKIRERYAPMKEAALSDYEAELRRQANNRPQAPEIPKAPPVPQRGQYVDQTQAKAMFYVASLMGALAMAGGRGRGMLAMSGMTGALEGFNEGNLERYLYGMKEYRENVDQQQTAYQNLYQNYMDAMTNDRLTLQQKIQAYDLISVREQDEIGRTAARSGDVTEMIKHATEILKLKEQLAKTTAGSPIKMNAAELKNLWAIRGEGGTTGVPIVDRLSPAAAKQLAGMTPKPTAAQTKQQDQLIGASRTLQETEKLIDDMDAKGYLPKGPGKASAEVAAARRWLHSSDPTLTNWNSLSGAMVGYDRFVFADIGARVKDAYMGSLNLFNNPGTKQGMKEAIGRYRYLLEQSPEAQRVLQAQPGAFDYQTYGESQGRGGQSADMVKEAAPPGLPSGGTLMKGKILVKRKSDGKISPLSEKYFDPAIYEKLPEGQLYQPGAGPARVGRGFDY